ncbi:MAG: PCP degradation transcriptional activation protein [Stenotrophomonas maltophilia]|nr:MAG: PCP degradation transcriptional activation protein [Stenotrophomonas maltophilia]
MITHGAADIAIGVFEALPARLHRRRLYDESLVCVVRRGHPLLSSGLSLEQYVAAEHVQVVVTGLGDSALDRALAQQGLSRRISVRLPHFLVAPQLVVDSDRLLSLPARLARQMTEELPVELLPLPLDVGVFEVSMIWHERRHADPVQIWLRQQLLEIGQRLAQV